VSSQPIRFLDETRARLAYIGSANVYDDINTVQAQSNVRQASAIVEDSKESLTALVVGSSVERKVSVVFQDVEQSINNEDPIETTIQN
jgi:ABC-type dipeptide/oligopeptide/nickel transport system ATPase subunit